VASFDTLRADHGGFLGRIDLLLAERRLPIKERVKWVDGRVWRGGQLRCLHILSCAGRCSVYIRPITIRDQYHVLNGMTLTRSFLFHTLPDFFHYAKCGSISASTWLICILAALRRFSCWFMHASRGEEAVYELIGIHLP
jgi:hypothetical protein